jgi:hypothetical protein
MTRPPLQLERELARCNAEIAAITASRDALPAWIVALTVRDWEAERRLILLRLSEEQVGGVKEVDSRPPHSAAVRAAAT